MPYGALDPTTAEAAPVTNIGAPVWDAGMELQDIRSEVLAQLQGRTDVVPAGDYTRLDRWINWGYVNVAQMLDLKELWASILMPTVADQPLYMLPSQVSWIKRVLIQDETEFVTTGGMELAEIDEQTYRNLPESDEVDTSPLLPQAWFRYGRMLVEWPTPDDVYALAVDCRIRPLPLTDPQDCPLLPEEFHEAICQAAIERAWNALGSYDRSIAAGNRKLSIVRPLLNTDAEERSAMHMGFAPARSRADLYRGSI
jgi:hypothetical protein